MPLRGPPAAAEDGELFRLAREHVHRDNPETDRTDERIRERLGANAHDLEPVR
jgi:hypothetical protein